MSTSASFPSRHLTGFVAGHGAPTHLAYPRLFAPMPVQLQSDTFDVFDAAAESLRAMDILIGPRDKAPQVDLSTTTDTYAAKVYGAIASYTPSEVRNASSALNVQEAKAKLALRILQANLERVLSAGFQAAMTTASKVYTPAGSGTDYVWDDYTSGRSYPIRALRAQIAVVTDALWADRETLKITVGLDEKVIDGVVEHPEVLARVSGGSTSDSPARVGLLRLAELLEVDEVMRLNSKTNTAAAGVSTPVMTRTWNKGGFIVAEPRGPAGMDTPCFGKLFNWDGYTELGMKSEGGIIVDMWKEPNPEVTYVRARHSCDAKITNASAARYLYGLIA
jgi:hypothetical protein